MKGPRKWQPSEEAYQKYLLREIELAKKNYCLGRRSPSFRPAQDLLHSKATIFAAVQELLADSERTRRRDSEGRCN